MNIVEEVVFSRVLLRNVLLVQDNDYDRFILIMNLLGYKRIELADFARVNPQDISETIRKCKMNARRKFRPYARELS
jgi:hypothetical protein